jgi:SAM-dependent methyltransferase
MKTKPIDVYGLSMLDKINLLYVALLERNIDPVGLEYWSEMISKEGFSYKSVIDQILNSPEYLMHYEIPFEVMLHRSRQAWCASLGHYEKVLDIGGSSSNIPEGALIELGYTFKPGRIDILDKPVDQQYWGKPKYEQRSKHEFDWGVVSYHHHDAENIDDFHALDDEAYDMVFMGQVIEHIRPEALPGLLAWIKLHLKAGGRFILDTPNRNLTIIQSPDSFIDADHKIEYTPEQLKKILNEAGFDVVKETGLLCMPGSRSSGIFNPLEVYDQPLLSDDADSSYLFAFECGLS